ncbi:MAG: sugar nucleotide-binding protein [Micrococcales bacterium]|nr:sugar nucleotide-binding protein [Micrococcales bacterium]
MRIVVTGGLGDLGSRVVRTLQGHGHDAVPVSRRSGVDLATGRGLEAGLAGADAVVHCADDPRKGDLVTVDGTRRLAEFTAAADLHLVHISIVGIDAIALKYYQRKLAAERAIAEAGGPATVLRATQFHSLTAWLARSLTRGPVTLAIGQLAFQPVDIDYVATRLVQLATGASPAAYERATDVAGPEVLTIGELAAMLRAHRGATAPRVLRVPAVGGLMRALAARANVAGPGADLGGRRFVDWLAEQPPGAHRGVNDGWALSAQPPPRHSRCPCHGPRP